MLRHRPALRVAVLLVGGILLSSILPFSTAALWTVLAILFILQLILAILTPRSVFTLIAFHFAVFLLSVTWTTMRLRDLDSTALVPHGPDASVACSAFLEEVPVRQGNSCKLVMQCDSMRIGGVARPGSRILGFYPWNDSGLIQSLSAGVHLNIAGTLEEFPRPRNPGEFDYGKFLRLKGIDGIVRIDSIMFDSTRQPGRSARSWFAGLRADFGAVLRNHHSEESAGFLQGVLFGDRRDIPSELKESFLNTGTIHILAVSGSNVATIALMIYLVLGLFRLSKRWIVALTVIGLLFYMMLTGAESSIVRATIMGCIIVVGTAMERRTDIFNSIAVAAVVVLLIDPLQLYDVGFQLSFAAVISIVTLYPRLDRLVEYIPESLEEFRILMPVWKVFAVSLAAQLGTLPFTAVYFEQFSIVSFVANIVVVPLVGVNLILGCLTIVAHGIAEWIAAAYGALNEVLVQVLLGFVRVAAEVPYAAVKTFGFGLLSSLMYYAILAGLANIQNRRIAFLSCVFALSLLTTAVYRDIFEERNMVRLTMLDVGQGDAVLFEFPNGSRVLVDGGPMTFGYDAGTRAVVPFLARQGISSVDVVVMSHPHSDHIGGLMAVLEEVTVGTVVEADTISASKLHSAVRTMAGRSGVSIRYAAAGEDLSPDPHARLYVLHPQPRGGDVGDVNNRSLVLKLTYGTTTAILAGDAEEEAEAEIVRRYGDFLDSDILKTGHHGSSTSSTKDFLHSITPKIALISVGVRNKFGHPSADVVERLNIGGATVLRTDLEGALMFESNGKGWNHIAWRQ